MIMRASLWVTLFDHGKLLLENNYWHELTEAYGLFKNAKIVHPV